MKSRFYLIVLIAASTLFGCKSNEKNKVIEKVPTILKKYTFVDMSELSFNEGSNSKLATFDGKTCTFIKRTMTSISSFSDNKELLEYTVRVEDNNKIYIDFIENGSKVIYEFDQNANGESYIDGKYTLFAHNQETNEVAKNINDLIFTKPNPVNQPTVKAPPSNTCTNHLNSRRRFSS